jgi:hypothetical protein
MTTIGLNIKTKLRLLFRFYRTFRNVNRHDSIIASLFQTLTLFQHEFILKCPLEYN